MTSSYAGIVGAPVTPFKADNSVDFETFAKQVDFLVENGVSLIAHPMHIGESVNLTDSERRELARVLVSAAAGRVPTFVHVSFAGTDLAIDLARHSIKAGATGIVLMAPYHWRSGPQAIVEHFVSVTEACGGKLIVYNNPKATNVDLSMDVLEQLMDRLPGFVAIKDATFHMETFTDICELIARKSKPIAAYTGIEYLLTSVPVGGSGCFSACSEVAPRLTAGLYQACVRGDTAKARELQFKVRRLLKVVMHNYPATIKYAMELLGRPVGSTRKPILPPTAAEKTWVKAELTALGVFEHEPQGWHASGKQGKSAKQQLPAV
jgi:4-hydroxy-tetrahydrodipicolinate synthase